MAIHDNTIKAAEEFKSAIDENLLINLGNKTSDFPKSQLPVAKISQKISGGSDAILAGMFQSIMFAMKVKDATNGKMNNSLNLQVWDQLMWAYLRDPKNGVKNNTKDMSSARGNLQKEILKSKMTWKVFCKALRFLNVYRFDFVIRTYHAKGDKIEHSITVNLGTPLDLPD